MHFTKSLAALIFPIADEIDTEMKSDFWPRINKKDFYYNDL